MIIKSKLNFVLIPLTLLVTMGSGVLLFIVYIIIRTNISDLIRLNVVAGVLTLSWFGILPLAMMLIVNRNYVIHPDRLEVKYLFGLIRNFYDYEDLKLSDYRWGGKGILIELSDGDQMTLGERHYTNYKELKASLENKIRKESLDLQD